MLTVKTPEEVLTLIGESAFAMGEPEAVPLSAALGRVLAEAVTATEFVPDFDRSTVDGYAVRGADTFGCSDSIPAILTVTGSVLMGQAAEGAVEENTCMAVPTGGALPQGADAVVMIEYTEDYGDGTIGVMKPAAPGSNLVYRGDDVRPGKVILQAGRVLTAADIGALAALGRAQVTVAQRPKAAVISTGDELVDVTEQPGPGQVRDVNSALLAAAVTSFGGEAVPMGALRDEETLLEETVRKALEQCDCVLISGGSSVGEKDATCRVIDRLGELLFHGIAMKPGKPTILGVVEGKPVMGLPGHPGAAFFVANLFLKPLLARMQGRTLVRRPVPAVLTETVSANHGRAQYTGVHLTERDGVLYAEPIRSKSGLISTLAGSDGYFEIPRDCEGLPQGSTVAVTVYHME